ncbi:MAG: xanthine dehydrogenase family protein molybdopterin-binding subunit [Gemmatimonadales bacterium]|nr:xanthine dehydrogenase family protein molybdopterin-binding subunit [Gemmatimonadales bacterium]
MNTSDRPSSAGLTRREFLATTGGMVFAVAGGGLLGGCRGTKDPKPTSINAWVQIRPNGEVIVYAATVEMGQGALTALPLIVAEEMDADWSRVRIEYAPIEPAVYGHDGWGGGPTMLIAGSISVAYFFSSLRVAGAQVRQVLLVNAAARWSVPVTELATEPHAVVHRPTGRRLTYGQVASFGQIPDPLPVITPELLKKPGEFRLIGSRTPRRDVREKVDGTAIYSIDVSLPGMVYAVASRSPVFRARPTLTNEAEVRRMQGVLSTVTLAHGVAVVAASFDAALRAKKGLQIEWSGDAPATGYDSQREIAGYRRLANAASGKTEIARKGNVRTAGAAKVYSAEFLNDYAYHAQMEPLNAVVALGQDRRSAEVWVGTQVPNSVRVEAARALGLEVTQVTVHRCYMGGGFGRRAARDYVVEACEVAKQTDRPVKMIWTREDDVQYGAFRPMSLQRLRAGVDRAGTIVRWEHLTIGPAPALATTGVEIPFYDIPNQLMESIGVDHGIRTRSWRAEGHGANKFAIEAFLDEVAADQGIDPVEYRRRLLRNEPRALRVFDRVVEMADRGGTPVPGRAKGISFAERNSIAACVCEISLDRSTGIIRVHRVWIALDAGIVIQPDNVVAQVEGAAIMGISSTLKERITFKEGRVEQSNFHDYPILRMSEAPERIEVEIIPSTEAPTGVGEVAVPQIAGAVANAFATLTGRRLKHLPFTPERVRGVLIP